MHSQTPGIKGHTLHFIDVSTSEDTRYSADTRNIEIVPGTKCNEHVTPHIFMYQYLPLYQ